MEAVLGMRQASISQHLMVLRKAGLVTTQRDGRNIFYRLAYPEVVEILYQAAQLAGIQPEALQRLRLDLSKDAPARSATPALIQT